MGDADATLAPTFETWRQLLHYIVEQAAGQRVVVILDELPYACDSDPALSSELQNAWDLFIQDSKIFLVVAGSHMGMMYDLFSYSAPLYGRATAKLHIKPLSFATMRAYFPRWSAAERVAAYAIVGGVPAYWRLFDDAESIAVNVKRQMLTVTGIFRDEARYLIADLVREPRNYVGVLRAIGEGYHTPAEIARSTGLESQHVGSYLDRLQALALVERRLPTLLPVTKRERRTTQGRYHIVDPFTRFFFRFLAPYQDLLDREQTDLAWKNIQAQARGFIGGTTFEDLCREWCWITGCLPFAPQQVGSHWQVAYKRRRKKNEEEDRAPIDDAVPLLDQPAPTVATQSTAGVQVDVVAVNWDVRAYLLAECKWTIDPIGRDILVDLLEKKSGLVQQTLPDKGIGWTVHYALFARAGFTEACRELAIEHAVILVDLERLDHDLEQAAHTPPLAVDDVW